MSLSRQSPSLPGRIRPATTRTPGRGYWLRFTRSLHSLFRPIRIIRISDSARLSARSTPTGGESRRECPTPTVLFFRFASSPARLIVYVWFNDENSLRKDGSKTDEYQVFKGMLARGEVPSSMVDLLKASSRPWAETSGEGPFHPAMDCRLMGRVALKHGTWPNATP